MNDIIQLLPDSVANQIAAGEVIQRPASIIKELVENSLDAGATRIQVIVTDAGKTCVQVIDDGKGMSETDARLSFERHATSKIKNADDLFALTTMGFRGEALASIAAVAQVELKTRRAEDELGVQINIEGSKVIGQEAVMCPVGANFAVKNLFFNTPVRRKYLANDRTELKNITNEFERIALAHPEINLTLSTPDATILSLPASNFRQRIINIFGKNLDKHLLHVEVETSVVQIVGYVGTPESSKNRSVPQFLFVNGRFMKNVTFAAAVMKAYERLIPDGFKVPFFLQFFVDPSRIDVNIHPTKTEINFEDKNTIFAIILSAVKQTLGESNAIPTIDFDTEGKPEIPVFTNDMGDVREPTIRLNPNFNPFDTASDTKESRHNAAVHTAPRPARSYDPVSRDFVPTPPDFIIPTQTDPTHQLHNVVLIDAPEMKDEKKLYEELPTVERSSWEAASAEFIQYKGRFIITPHDEGLLIIDMHRAHTRVLYEEYTNNTHEHPQESQGLLFAHILELSPIQSGLLETMTDEIEALGFNISPLGGGSYSVMGVPSGIDGVDPVQLLQNIVDDAFDKGYDTKEQLRHSAALTLARRAAIPVGQHLSQDEMRELAVQLFRTSNPNITPDGKAILTIVPDDNILAKFR